MEAAFDFGRARDFVGTRALDAHSVDVLLTGLTTDSTSIHGTDPIAIVDGRR